MEETEQVETFYSARLAKGDGQRCTGYVADPDNHIWEGDEPHSLPPEEPYSHMSLQAAAEPMFALEDDRKRLWCSYAEEEVEDRDCFVFCGPQNLMLGIAQSAEQISRKLHLIPATSVNRPLAVIFSLPYSLGQEYKCKRIKGHYEA